MELDEARRYLASADRLDPLKANLAFHALSVELARLQGVERRVQRLAEHHRTTGWVGVDQLRKALDGESDGR